jgi:putative MATE family efflux protein
MEQSKKFDRAMLGTIFTLAWPTMLEQLTQTAVQYIDTAMVGALGTRATAAVGATGTVNWMVGSVVSAIGVGFLAFIARKIGAGRPEDARKASGQACMTALVLGTVLTVLTQLAAGQVPVWMQVDPEIRDLAARYFAIIYLPMLFRTASILFGTVLRSAGDTRTPMRIGLTVNIINMVLNFLLIFPSRELKLWGLTLPVPGAGMGVEGAAWASAASFVYGGAAMARALWKHPVVSPRGQSLRPDMEILRPCFRVALPNLAQRFATSFGYVVFASMINALGGISTAAHTIANTVESAFYIPGWGMQTAAATLSGNAYGAKDHGRLRRLGSTILPLEIGLMVISGGLLFLLAEPLVRLFTRDESVVRLGTTVLRMVAVSEPFYGVPIVVEGLMQGVGKTTAPFFYNVAGMWGIRILGTWICTRLLGLGLVAAWGCMIGHNLLLFGFFAWHYLSGRWDPFPKETAS